MGSNRKFKRVNFAKKVISVSRVGMALLLTTTLMLASNTASAEKLKVLGAGEEGVIANSPLFFQSANF